MVQPYFLNSMIITEMILTFRTARAWQTEEQSDQALHGLQFQPHVFDPLPCILFIPTACF